MPIALFPRRRQEQPAPVIESKHLPADAELIRSRQQIITLLHQLRDSHNLLTVELPECDEDFTSALIELDTRDDLLSLDELTPREGHELLERAGYCYVSTHLRGVFLGFCARLLKTYDGATALYEMRLPDAVDYAQRRQHYRVEIPASASLPVLMITTDNIRISGVVRDISESGLCALLNQSPDTLQAGSLLPRCSVELPNHKKVLCGIELTHVGNRYKDRRVRIGGRFTGLRPVDQRELQRVVVEFERARRRTEIKQ
jgi:c-di-GMP-binding flagellar brake protein YcgR